jgi:hypothetical protein
MTIPHRSPLLSSAGSYIHAGDSNSRPLDKELGAPIRSGANSAQKLIYTVYVYISMTQKSRWKINFSDTHAVCLIDRARAFWAISSDFFGYVVLLKTSSGLKKVLIQILILLYGIQGGNVISFIGFEIMFHGVCTSFRVSGIYSIPSFTTAYSILHIETKTYSIAYTYNFTNLWLLYLLLTKVLSFFQIQHVFSTKVSLLPYCIYLKVLRTMGKKT